MELQFRDLIKYIWHFVPKYVIKNLRFLNVQYYIKLYEYSYKTVDKSNMHSLMEMFILVNSTDHIETILILTFLGKPLFSSRCSKCFPLKFTGSFVYAVRTHIPDMILQRPYTHCMHFYKNSAE